MEKLGLWAATFIGIGAIVGGGIFVLGGVALIHAGPAALVAFLLNGALALLTARSFSVLVRAFPESGGTYVYAKRVLSVRAAFVIGWMLWLAHLLAALLYALGFAAYFGAILGRLWTTWMGAELHFLSSRFTLIGLSAAACAFYTLSAIRQQGAGGNLSNILKLVLFAALIAGGFWVVGTKELTSTSLKFTPFAPTGLVGIASAMGYTFIALQGFELIGAVAGQISDAPRVVPRAMYLALGTALAVYVPLVLVVIAVGSPGGIPIQSWCAERVDTCIADATQTYLGSIGYWGVSLAAVFATLSALRANLSAASDFARTMAVDRTMPKILAGLHVKHQTPEVAILTNFVIVVVLLFALPNTAAAGSAASLTFLLCFAFAHWLCFLVARRKKAAGKDSQESRKSEVALPALGGLACFGLAALQLAVELGGGAVLLAWTGVGALLYYIFLSERAEVLDAFSEGRDPSLFQFRGRAPVVLVPVRNPKRVEALADLAEVVAPKATGRILLLAVALGGSSTEETQERLSQASSVISQALHETVGHGRSSVEGIITLSNNPWDGIREVGRTYHCETVLLGLSASESSKNGAIPDKRISEMLETLRMNVVILKSPPGWHLSSAKKVVVPIGGKGDHDRFRARILGRLAATKSVESVVFLRILPTSVSSDSVLRVRRSLEERVADESGGYAGSVLVMQHDSPVSAILEQLDEESLLILGLSGKGRERGALGAMVTEIIEAHAGSSLVIRHGEA